MHIDKFGYAAEKLAAGRRMLMAPHPRGEAESFANAFHECLLGLRDLQLDDFDGTARPWVVTIRKTMETAGIEDASGKGTWKIKAERLTVDEKIAFSSALDQLADWCERAHEEA